MLYTNKEDFPLPFDLVGAVMEGWGVGGGGGGGGGGVVGGGVRSQYKDVLPV